MASKKTVIVTGASQGIGAAVVQAFLDRSYNIVATSRSVSRAGFAPSPNLALVDDDIGQAATAEKVAQTAITKFGSVNHVVNNAGIFSAKPFTDYTAEDFLHQPGRVHLHHPAGSQADAVARRRRQRDQHHRLLGQEPHCGAFQRRSQ
jgi:NAD(P)-dependent dehydrogenase (short-subunit alcohol dehydrogenase family)